MTLLLIKNRGDLEPNTGFWRKVYRATLNCLTSLPSHGEEDIYETCLEYCEEAGVQRDWPRDVVSGWPGRVMEAAAAASSTIFKTHVETNLFIYSKRFLEYLFETDTYSSVFQSLPRKHFNAIFICASEAFVNQEDIDVVVTRKASVQKLEIEGSVWELAAECIQRLREVVPANPDLRQHCRSMFHILAALEGHAIELQDRFVNGEFEDDRSGGRRRKRKWRFNMCPQMHWRPKYLQISTTALKAMLNKLARSNKDIKETLAAIKREEGLFESQWEKDFQYWDRFFNLRTVLRQVHRVEKTKKRFGNSVSTDGIGVSACIETKKNSLDLSIIRLRDKIKEKKNLGVDEDLQHLDEELKEKQKAKKDLDSGKVINPRVRDLLQIEKIDDKYHCNAKVVAIDPGKRTAATWVVHDADHQQLLQSNQPTVVEDRYQVGMLHSGQWIFHSGQKQYTKKMSRRMGLLCPGMRECPSTKTVSIETLLAAYAHQNAQWSNIKRAYFDEHWTQKQKFKRYVKRQKALEDVVASITGTRNKEAQKKVVVAYGDGDIGGNMRGLPPIMSSTLAKKMRQSASVVFVNEFRTSMNCSCCHEAMRKTNKFRVKCCETNSCTRTYWNRDINAAINILHLFLELCHAGTRNSKFTRQ
jgi:transposase